MFQGQLQNTRQIIIHQENDFAELMGYEARNKYRINLPSGECIGYAAEQQKSFWGFLFRQFLGHWRRFEIHVFDPQMNLQVIARHPFRFLFQRVEVSDPGGKLIGAVQQRFSFLTKRFDIEDSSGSSVMSVHSPLWKLWNFPFYRDGEQVALVKKIWGGTMKETFTDADTFSLEFTQGEFSAEERLTLLAATLFIDIQYFENRARKKRAR